MVVLTAAILRDAGDTMWTLPSTGSTSTLHPNFVSSFNTGLKTYERETKNDLNLHPLLPILQSCKTPEAILDVLKGQILPFGQSQNGDYRLAEWVRPTVNVLYAFSITIGQGNELVNIKMLS
jgi:hypothetical protein